MRGMLRRSNDPLRLYRRSRIRPCLSRARARAIRCRIKEEEKKRNRRNEKRTREERSKAANTDWMEDAPVTHDGLRAGRTAEKMYIHSDTAKDTAADGRGRKKGREGEGDEPD